MKHAYLRRYVCAGVVIRSLWLNAGGVEARAIAHNSVKNGVYSVNFLRSLSGFTGIYQSDWQEHKQVCNVPMIMDLQTQGQVDFILTHPKSREHGNFGPNNAFFGMAMPTNL